MRRTESQSPRLKPWVRKASAAYWEQVGRNRHVDGNSGDKSRW